MTYRNLESTIGRVSSVLLRQATQGDTRCLRLFFEVMGKIGSQKKELLCTRNHVLTPEEAVTTLQSILNEHELRKLAHEVREHCFSTRIREADCMSIREDVQLSVV